MKVCSKCGVEKEDGEYYIKKRIRNLKIKFALSSSCKKCWRIQTQAWTDKNPEKVAAIKRKWVLNNPEKRKDCANKWARENYNIENVRKWQKNNPEKVKAIFRKWYLKNPEKVKEIHSRPVIAITDAYVRGLFSKSYNIPNSVLNEYPLLIKLKREFIKNLRLNKN